MSIAYVSENYVNLPFICLQGCNQIREIRGFGENERDFLENQGKSGNFQVSNCFISEQ